MLYIISCYIGSSYNANDIYQLNISNALVICTRHLNHVCIIFHVVYSHKIYNRVADNADRVHLTSSCHGHISRDRKEDKFVTCSRIITRISVVKIWKLVLIWLWTLNCRSQRYVHGAILDQLKHGKKLILSNVFTSTLWKISDFSFKLLDMTSKMFARL